MGLFKSLKGQGPDYIGRESSSSNDNYNQYQILEEKYRVFGTNSSEEQYEAPPGPPPNRQHGEYESPPGPPPNRQHGEYEAPPGPPPNRQRGEYEAPPESPPNRVAGEFEPPPGPPPTHQKSDAPNPPPYHDWMSVPDNSLLPPPPTVRHEYSTNNSSEDDADRGHRWCNARKLFTSSKPHSEVYNSVQAGDLQLIRPQELNGQLTKVGHGHWHGKTKGTRDNILLTSLPLYFAAGESPRETQVEKTIYFEVKINRIGAGHRSREDSGLAMGFCAQPYPSWRLPGHERGSFGVHGDDGRRFVNDSFGGIDCTEPFRAGQTLGIGMNITPSRSPNRYGIAMEVFFTRNGKQDGSWDMFEERDETAGNIYGLEGQFDLYGAIGTFGDVEFETAFSREGWLYQPRG